MMIFKKSRIRSETSTLLFNNVTGPMEMMVHTNMVLTGIEIERKERSRASGTSFPLATVPLSS
jgi:hypothetical protein